MSHRDTQRCYHILNFGQCKYLHINQNGRVVHDGLEAEVEHRGQRQKDEMRVGGGAQRSHDKDDDKGREKRSKKYRCGPRGEAGPTLETGQEGVRSSTRGRRGWETSRLEVPVPVRIG